MSNDYINKAEEFFRWCNTTAQARVYYFEVPSAKIQSIMDHDTSFYYGTSMRGVFSENIEKYVSMDKQIIDRFYSTHWGRFNQHDDPDLYFVYQMHKILWLANDIRKRGQIMPIQLIQTGRTYNAHPGSDKKISMLMFNPHLNVKGFYIHYPIVDPDPWIWTVENDEIKTAQEFFDLFPHRDDKSFILTTEDVNFKQDGFNVSDNHLVPWAEGIDMGLRKYGNKREGLDITLKTISYRDAVHRKAMVKSAEMFKSLNINVDGDRFEFGDWVFFKRNGMWTEYRELDYGSPLSTNVSPGPVLNTIVANRGQGRHYL